VTLFCFTDLERNAWLPLVSVFAVCGLDWQDTNLVFDAK
jgi:hypothetical protein